MRRALRYFTRPIGLVMALTILVLPVLLTPGGITACPSGIGWIENPAANQDCRVQTDPLPDAFCVKVCGDGVEDQCMLQCGTAAIEVTDGACLFDGDHASECDCLADCEEE